MNSLHHQKAKCCCIQNEDDTYVSTADVCEPLKCKFKYQQVSKGFLEEYTTNKSDEKTSRRLNSGGEQEGKKEEESSQQRDTWMKMHTVGFFSILFPIYMKNIPIDRNILPCHIQISKPELSKEFYRKEFKKHVRRSR